MKIEYVINHTNGGGGVRKVPKKCHILFEWHLTVSKFIECYFFSEVCISKMSPFSWKLWRGPCVTGVTVGLIDMALFALNEASCELIVSIVSIGRTSLKRRSQGNDVFYIGNSNSSKPIRYFTK